jgi:hypothetical protein
MVTAPGGGKLGMVDSLGLGTGEGGGGTSQSIAEEERNPCRCRAREAARGKQQGVNPTTDMTATC